MAVYRTRWSAFHNTLVRRHGMKDFVKSAAFAAIGWALVLVAAIIAFYHLISYPAVIGTIAAFAITGAIVLLVRRYVIKKA